MNIFCKNGNWRKDAVDLIVLSVTRKKGAGSLTWREWRDVLSGDLGKILEEEAYQGKFGEWVAVRTLGRELAKFIGVLGLGEASNRGLDNWRKWGGLVLRHAREVKAKTVLIPVSWSGSSEVLQERAQALLEGLCLAQYRFHAYKNLPDEEKSSSEVTDVMLIVEDARQKKIIERAITRARAIAEAVHLSRDLVNTPSAEMTPLRLVEIAKEISDQDERFSLTILDQEKLREKGMQPTLAVAQGSAHLPYGVHLVYRPQKKAKKRLALVGKAVTFDSGGLSLKTADGMATMKIDMAGAAAVLGVMQALPFLNLSIEVHGIFLAVENMPSGQAYRPGDIVKAMNGTTIEVLNTDAEGRLTLADALAYAAEQKPDEIVDLATLTGACVVALGEEVAGLMSNHSSFAQKLKRAGDEAGELVWELPLVSTYEALIKSKVADLKNTGGKAGGTITAGLFLAHFVPKNIPWAHLDIAGPSYTEKETRPDQPYGASGFGVRLLLRYLEKFL